MTRPTEEEAVSPKAGGPKEIRTRNEGDERTRPSLGGLWLLSKKNNLTTRFTSRWCSSRPCEQPMLPERI